jgi:hypothetical protein
MQELPRAVLSHLQGHDALTAHRDSSCPPHVLLSTLPNTLLPLLLLLLALAPVCLHPPITGTMEGGRQADVSKAILSRKDVPYVVAAPLLIQVGGGGWGARGRGWGGGGGC